MLNPNPENEPKLYASFVPYIYIITGEYGLYRRFPILSPVFPYIFPGVSPIFFAQCIYIIYSYVFI